MVVNHCSAEARFALFISLKFSENLREIKSAKRASLANINHAKIDEEFDDMFNLHCLAAASALVIATCAKEKKS